MKIVVYSPDPPPNDYLSVYYLSSLYEYLKDTGRDVSLQRDGLISISNSKILIDVTNLDKVYPLKDNGLINQLKNNGNKLYCFDINDHSSLGFYDMDISGIDFIFKIAGVQNSDYCDELYIDNDLTYRLEQKPFYPIDSKNYTNLKELIASNKIMSLPYVLNDNDENPGRPYENRVKKCLVRGAHFKRVHLFFNLLKKDLADSNSAFHIKSYQHFLCNDCQNKSNGREYNYSDYKSTGSFDCKNQAVKWYQNPPSVDWDGIRHDNLFNVHRWAWNNRCFPQYYWLLDKFMTKYGSVDTNIVSRVLNNPHLNSHQLNDVIGQYLFYGDFKWIFSIYAPQRFWQAARCRCINLLPNRAGAQIYFPEMTENNHFICFKEDFSDLDKLNNVTKEQYEHITNNCYSIYNQYIKFGKYRMNENLMNEILKRIEV